MNFITIFASNSEIQAQSIKSLLEGSGIEVNILDDNHVTIDPFIAQAIGGVKIQVKHVNKQEAFEILKESGYMDSNEAVESDSVVFITKLESLANKIPIINQIPSLTVKLFSTLIVVILLIMGVMSLFVS